MRVTFLDSSYLLALVHDRDPMHGRARQWQRIARGEFLTTEYMLIHLVDTLADDGLRDLGLEMSWLLRTDPGVGVVPASTTLMEEGLRLFQEQTRLPWTLTECISFATMLHAGVVDVLTTNRRFEQAGFHSLLRTEPPAEPEVIPAQTRAAICEAIRDRRLVQFQYHHGVRVVEPYRYGRSVLGHELLRAYQRRGHSKSGEPVGWKTFRLADIRDLVVLNEVFAGFRPHYSAAESRMSEVYCQV